MSATVQHPQPLHELAPGLALARGGPGRTLNIYLLGTIVLDSGVRWSRRRLGRQLAGRRITAHALTHAHFDHAGSSAWLCETLGVPLWCGAGDAAAIGTGRVDTLGTPWISCTCGRQPTPPPSSSSRSSGRTSTKPARPAPTSTTRTRLGT